MVDNSFVYKITTHIIPFFVASLIVFSSITGFYRLNDLFYYIALAIAGICIVFSRRLRVGDVDVLLLIFICILSLLINNPPPYFRAWQRLGVYFLLVCIIGPVLRSNYATLFRKAFFRSFWAICIVLSIGSFFSYYLGVNYFVRQGEVLEIGVGTFSGLMNHSMILGPIAGMATIVSFVQMITGNNRFRLLYGTVTVLCLGACFLSASRAAVGSSIAGCLFSLYIIFRKRLSKFLTVLLIVLSVGSATYPFWGSVTTLVIQKQERNTSMGGAFYSREIKMAARIDEFRSSPIIGIGFCTINPSLDGVDRSTGQIEPGSSWLAIASMTGVLGLLVFLSIYLKSFRRVLQMTDMYWAGVLGGLLVFYAIHMTVEGYIYAPRSILSLLLWLVVSIVKGFSNDYRQVYPTSFIK